jgi:hypothetical protein
MPSIQCRRIGATALVALAGAAGLSAQDQAPPPADAALLQRVEALEQQVSAMKPAVDKLQSEKDVDNSFAWGGYLDLSLDLRRRTSTNDPPGREVGVAFNPILMYGWRDQWLAVAELNVGSSGGSTTTDLGQGFIAFTGLPDAVILAGLAPLPFGTFSELFSPSWINKMGEIAATPYDEDFGLFTSDISDQQVQVRGIIDLGDNRRLDWHAFMAQAPTYAMNDGTDDRLSFGGNTGRGHEPPTFGGRLGFQPQPGIEIGASVMGGQILNNNLAFTPEDHRRFVAYGFDAEYHVSGAILRGEWIALKYDASDETRVNSQSGYIQLSKRLKELGDFWADVEPVIRVGELRRNQPVTTAAQKKINEYGGGLNYYFTSTIRSSLIADVFLVTDEAEVETHDLNRIVFNTTFAF